MTFYRVLGFEITIQSNVGKTSKGKIHKTRKKRTTITRNLSPIIIIPAPTSPPPPPPPITTMKIKQHEIGNNFK